VNAYIGANAKVTAGGNITVLADNNTYANRPNDLRMDYHGIDISKATVQTTHPPDTGERRFRRRGEGRGTIR
jgi:hypothetical protein